MLSETVPMLLNTDHCLKYVNGYRRGLHDYSWAAVASCFSSLGLLLYHNHVLLNTVMIGLVPTVPEGSNSAGSCTCGGWAQCYPLLKHMLGVWIDWRKGGSRCLVTRWLNLLLMDGGDGAVCLNNKGHFMWGREVSLELMSGTTSTKPWVDYYRAPATSHPVSIIGSGVTTTEEVWWELQVYMNRWK
jgi:hypothetical protein